MDDSGNVSFLVPTETSPSTRIRQCSASLGQMIKPDIYGSTIHCGRSKLINRYDY